MGTAIGLGIGVIIGQNWNRIQKGLSWLGNRLSEELLAEDDYQWDNCAGYDPLTTFGLVLLERDY
ncbi:MAG: hypothetical protein F6K31_22470 [Symploca sp. SIO2G7]|nr:hypothetical protein [Symploca sp. SIO2G7]